MPVHTSAHRQRQIFEVAVIGRREHPDTSRRDQTDEGARNSEWIETVFDHVQTYNQRKAAVSGGQIVISAADGEGYIWVGPRCHCHSIRIHVDRCYSETHVTEQSAR